MKSKIFSLLVTFIVIMSLVACGNTADTPSDTNTQEQTQTSTEESEKSDVDTNESTLEDLEAYLMDKGVLSGEKTETMASMIGAISGFKYADSNAEFYEYDETSDAYQALAAGESVEIEGMSGFTVSAAAINGKYVLIASGDVSQELIDAFNTFK